MMAHIATPTSSPAMITRKNKQILPQKRKIKMNSDLEPVIAEAHKIANYLIPYHLRKVCKHESLQGLPKSYLIPLAQPSELYHCIARLSASLEKHESLFFENVPHHMKLRHENAKRVFFTICKEIFINGCTNWGRVVTIFTLGGTIAVYFTNKGQLDVVQKIPSWIKEIIETHVAEWIVENGGWDGIIKEHGTDSMTNASWSPYVTTFGVLAAAGMLFLGFRK